MHSSIQFNCTPEELEQIIIKGLKKYEALKEETLVSKTKTYSKNQVAKMLHRSHKTICDLIRDGNLITASDNKRVTAISVNEYLKLNKSK